MTHPGYVILTLKFQREDRRWLGECVELGTATYGRSLEQVHDELLELITLHLKALKDAGELERFFEEHGIRFYRDGTSSEVTPTVTVDREAFVQAHRLAVPAGA